MSRRLPRKLAIAGLLAIVGFTTACPTPWYFRRHERRDDRRERPEEHEERRERGDDHKERRDDHDERQERKERGH